MRPVTRLRLGKRFLEGWQGETYGLASVFITCTPASAHRNIDSLRLSVEAHR